MKKIVFVIVVIALVGGAYLAAHRRHLLHFPSHQSGIAAGGPLARPMPAPGFTLDDLSGKQFSLSDYRGKVVLLDFWATWCDPCRDEVPHFVDLQNKYRGQGLQIIGVSMDDGPKPVREFYDQYKMNYPVAVGTAKLAESYGGILGIPITFLIGRDGRIAAKYVGQVEMPILEDQLKSLLQTK
jgi:cytochrome c biogenesis protein CcmG/thiol:disulfide interchange protein DsbE